MLALTDREKRYLREAFQLEKKKLRGESLNQKEEITYTAVFGLVERGPCHNLAVQGSGFRV